MSLLDETAPTVSQTVNQIVDHTIETVTTQVPKPGSPQASEQDLLVAAIKVDTAHTASLYAYSTTTAPVVAGVYIPGRRGVLTLTTASLLKTMYIALPGGTTPQATIATTGTNFTFYHFLDGVTLPDATTPNFVASNTLKQGQRVIGIQNDGTVVVGIITKIDQGGISTDLPSLPAGSPVVNISGDMIGLASSNAGRVLSGELISTFLATLAK